MAKPSKIVYGNEVIIDLTNDTVRADKLLVGYSATGADGEHIDGACTFDANTSDATVVIDSDNGSSEILAGKTAYAKGKKITGTMPNRDGEGGTISDKSEQYTIRSGYHDGSGKVGIAETEKAKLIAGNIKSGVQILGVTGSYAGEGGTGQAKTVTPTKDGFSVLPDTGFDYLTQVTVSAIPYVEIPNQSGGLTVEIG